jgi:hypothetical protein
MKKVECDRCGKLESDEQNAAGTIHRYAFGQRCDDGSMSVLATNYDLCAPCYRDVKRTGERWRECARTAPTNSPQRNPDEHNR